LAKNFENSLKQKKTNYFLIPNVKFSLYFSARPNQLPAPATPALKLGPSVNIPFMEPQKLMTGNAECKTGSKNTTEDCQVFY